MKKVLSLLMIGFLMVGILAGCKPAKTPEPQKPDTEIGQPADQNQDENNVEDAIQAEGIYSGQIDNNSIEVMIDGEITVLMMYDVAKVLGGIQDGDKVSVEYRENEQGQLELIKIKKIK